MQRNPQVPVTAAPDIRAASKVNSTGPIPGITDPIPTDRDNADIDFAEAPSSPRADESPLADEHENSPSTLTDCPPSTVTAPGPQWTSGTNGETIPVTHGGRTYKTKEGDTLYGVASKHGVSVPALAELNRISPRQNLHQGQVLSLPEKNDLPDTDPSHVVAPGETLPGIAARHQMSLGALRRANSMGGDSFLQVGELLLLRDSTARRHRTPPVPPTDIPRVATSAQVEGIRPNVLAAARLNKFTLLQRTHPAPAQARIIVASIAEELGADPALMQAVAAQESGFQHTTVSAGNAIGIMQVTPRSGRWASDIVGRNLDLLDIADNIVAGTVILGWLVETAESENDALAGYYQDLRSVRSEGLLPETKAFVRSVQMQRQRMQEAL
ncbi:LysM peptidoglycan-binding domain-containing protein [Brevibacterium sp. CBA3109]|uniref:LysM peptidoglycan-binding domain-containing protein n=1 Tax=Brevibacterium koreense TaxID=3140787 RepID=A0AAU7UHU6_9MICO